MSLCLFVCLCVCVCGVCGVCAYCVEVINRAGERKEAHCFPVLVGR